MYELKHLRFLSLVIFSVPCNRMHCGDPLHQVTTQKEYDYPQHRGTHFLNFCLNHLFLLLTFFFFFLIRINLELEGSGLRFFCLCFRVAPMAYGISQARGQIGATAVGLCHSHSNVGSELCL